MIQSSLAFTIYFIIQPQSDGISVKSVVAELFNGISNDFIAIPRNSAREAFPFGLNVQSEYHLIIHLLTNRMMSSLANESLISGNVGIVSTTVQEEVIIVVVVQVAVVVTTVVTHDAVVVVVVSEHLPS